MEPRSALGGWAPSPKKESPAVSRIIQPTVVEMVIKITGSTFGRSSVKRILKSFIPESRAASTYSKRTRPTVAPLTLRAKKGMFTIDIAMSALKRPGPRTATIARARSM